MIRGLVEISVRIKNGMKRKLAASPNVIKTLGFFHRPENGEAATWVKKISRWILKHYPEVKIAEKKPDCLLVLGGDGSFLEAARGYQKQNPIILGLNLGRVGFLASIREPKKFLKGLNQFLMGGFNVSERIMLEATVLRKGKIVWRSYSLNDVVAHNLLGVSEIEVSIEHHPIQYIRGTGVMVATATGSTAYNLSAHGPIVMPSIKCLIVNELLDHNIPTPSIVVDSAEKIRIKIIDFRKHGLLALAKNKKPVDVILSSDGENIFPLAEGDIVTVKSSPRLVRFAELEKNYFLKSLQEKFAFK